MRLPQCVAWVLIFSSSHGQHGGPQRYGTHFLCKGGKIDSSVREGTIFSTSKQGGVSPVSPGARVERQAQRLAHRCRAGSKKC